MNALLIVVFMFNRFQILKSQPTNLDTNKPQLNQSEVNGFKTDQFQLNPDTNKNTNLSQSKNFQSNNNTNNPQLIDNLEYDASLKSENKQQPNNNSNYNQNALLSDDLKSDTASQSTLKSETISPLKNSLQSDTNYFQTQEYQDIALVIQYLVYGDADSKHFADMILKYNIFSIHENLTHLLNKYNISISNLKSSILKSAYNKNSNKDNFINSIFINSLDKKFESELFQFVNDNFLEEDDNLNIPNLKKVDLPIHFDSLNDELKSVYMNIHKLWFKYARSDLETGDKTLVSIENPNKTLKIEYKIKKSLDDQRKNENSESNVKRKNFENRVSKDGYKSDDKLKKNIKKNKNCITNNLKKDNKEITLDNKNQSTNKIDINKKKSNKKNFKNTEEQLRNKSVKEEHQESKIKLPSLYFVPGGRFKELYYWDSNWILLGLLHCNMNEYAFELIKALHYLINQYGYVPNGTRKYYLGRSQPPVFAQMLYRLYKHEINKNWILNQGLETLEKEYNWWMENRMSEFDRKKGYRLNRYNVHDVSTPRPESFKEDFSLNVDGIYKNLWAGAESGWDFSTRWFNGNGLESIDVEDIVPVDLNVFLLFVEEIIIFFYNEKSKINDKNKINNNFDNEYNNKFINDKIDSNILNKDNNVNGDNDNINNDNLNSNNLIDNNDKKDNNFVDSNTTSDIKYYKEKIKEYTEYRNKREHDINKLLWNKNQKVWNDYNTKTKKHKSDKFYLSNIMPLFIRTKIPDNSINIYNILDMYKKELFGYPGGIPITGDGCKLNCTPQQWDFPNVWAPLLQMFIEFVQTEEFSEFGTHVARCFYNSVSKGMGTNQEFHEKYDCRRVGLKGMGGEYAPQQGFGWTNGTIAWLIYVYGNQLVSNIEHLESYQKICEIIESRKK